MVPFQAWYGGYGDRHSEPDEDYDPPIAAGSARQGPDTSVTLFCPDQGGLRSPQLAAIHDSAHGTVA